MTIEDAINGGLKQGDKVRIISSGRTFIGRIEAKMDTLFFVNEHCYEGVAIRKLDEPMRYYNPLWMFSTMDIIEIITL